jgi:TRAP-type transport system small permease protein
MKMIHRIGRVAGGAADHVIGWLLLASVVLNVLQVFTRYVMNDPLFWTEEMVRYTTVWLTFVGAAAASLYGDHMDMNLFLDVRSPRFQRLHQALLQSAVFFLSLLLVWHGTVYCMLNGMQTAPATGLPMLAVYGAVVVGGVLLAVVSAHKFFLALFPELAAGGSQ